MSHSIEAVLFDLDGTLLDTAPDFVTSVNQLRINHQLDLIPENTIRACVSNGARALVTLALNITEGDPGFDEARLELLSLYEKNMTDKTTPFPGMREMLVELQLPWGIVTNKPFHYAKPIVEAMQFNPPAKTLVCPDHVTHTKPNPEPLLLACEQIQSLPANTIYCGDHKRDIEAGQAANMPTIACGFGYIDPSENIDQWNADAIVYNSSDMLKVIKTFL